MSTDTFGAVAIMALVLAAVAVGLTLQPTCGPASPSIKLGNVLMAGCP